MIRCFLGVIYGGVLVVAVFGFVARKSRLFCSSQSRVGCACVHYIYQDGTSCKRVKFCFRVSSIKVRKRPMSGDTKYRVCLCWSVTDFVAATRGVDSSTRPQFLILRSCIFARPEFLVTASSTVKVRANERLASSRVFIKWYSELRLFTVLCWLRCQPRPTRVMRLLLILRK